MIDAIKVVGSTIQVDELTFQSIMSEKTSGYVVTSKSGVFSTMYNYQLMFKDFLFFLQVKQPIKIPDKLEVIVADKIYTPMFLVN